MLYKQLNSPKRIPYLTLAEKESQLAKKAKVRTQA